MDRKTCHHESMQLCDISILLAMSRLVQPRNGAVFSSGCPRRMWDPARSTQYGSLCYPFALSLFIVGYVWLSCPRWLYGS